jgi:hypothetical protein
MSPIGAALGAKIVCEWFGETARAVRIERAVAETVRDGALGLLAGDARREREAMGEITQEIIRRL